MIFTLPYAFIYESTVFYTLTYAFHSTVFVIVTRLGNGFTTIS